MNQSPKNISDVALVFEGGGMRASYTSAVVTLLLENNIHFQNVYGVSAGSSNSVNYVSRDIWRAKASFTDLVADPEFGGLGSFLMRKGVFNAPYIYMEAGKPGGRFPFDFGSFELNPAEVTIEGFDRDNGETVYWTKKDFPNLHELMLRVRASSSLPFVMPAPLINGRYYYDGGLGEGSGIMVPKAQADGFEKFFVVCTRPRGYRKSEGSNTLTNAYFWKRPHVKEALATRPARYNFELENLEKLEAEGRAYVFYAEEQQAESTDKDLAKLKDNYRRGRAQAERELEDWATFLGI